MSNLYKQWFVRTETANTRVIDSNSIMTEYIEKSAYRTASEPPASADGFAAGLTPENAGSVIKAEPDHVMLAKEEAEQILEEAKQKADDLLRQAEAEACDIQTEAKERGYQEGREEQEREIEALRRELENSFQKKLQKSDDEYREKQKNMEHDLVDVILEVFNKVFHIQFDNKKHILMYLIDNAILNIEGEKRFRVRVAGSNVPFLENHKDEILDRVGHDIDLEILADSTMDGNDCVLETDSGVFDCSLGVQLENLIKDIRSLCS